MSGTLKVDAVAARRLLTSLGFPSQAEVSEDKLAKRLNSFEKLSDEFPPLENPEDVRLQEEIMEALKGGRKVVVPAADDGADGGDAPGRAAGKNGKAAGKNGKAGGNGRKPRNIDPALVGKAGGKGKPGVVKSIEEFLRDASAAKPLTRAQIGAKLKKRFPDRPLEGMMKTVGAQVPGQLKAQKDITVSGDLKKGFWIK